MQRRLRTQHEQDMIDWRRHVRTVPTHDVVMYQCAQETQRAIDSYSFGQSVIETFSRHRQMYCAQGNYGREVARLLVACEQWRITALERMQAYEQMKWQVNLYSASYRLSKSAKKALPAFGIISANYNDFFGNSLQHQLMSEIVAHINTAVDLPQPCRQHQPFQRFMYDETLKLLDTAREVNEMGLCVDAADLIDISATLIDYLSAIAREAVNGACDSLKGTVVGTFEIIRHPVEAVRALGTLAVTLARVMHQYLPPGLPDEGCTAQEFELYLKHLGQTAQRWKEAADTARMLWKNTSTCDLLYQAAYCISHLGTNVLVAQRCTQLLSTIAKSVQSHMILLGKQVNRAQLAMSAPGYILFESAATKDIFAYAAQQGFSPAYINQALRNYVSEQAIEGCLSSLNTAIGRYHHLPGAQALINDIFKLASIPARSRARGASCELICTLELERRGHSIVSFGQKIEKYTSDVITLTHLVECKNVRWASLLCDKEKFIRLQEQMARASEAALACGKRVMLYTKYAIPNSMSDLKKEIFKYDNIDVVIGGG